MERAWPRKRRAGKWLGEGRARASKGNRREGALASALRYRGANSGLSMSPIPGGPPGVLLDPTWIFQWLECHSSLESRESGNLLLVSQ